MKQVQLEPNPFHDVETQISAQAVVQYFKTIQTLAYLNNFDSKNTYIELKKIGASLIFQSTCF